MSEKSVRSATRPQSNQQQVAADCINQALEKSDIAEICHAIAAATRPPRTLRPAVGRADGLSIAGRPSGARLPAAIDALSPIADALGTIADIGPVRSLTQPLAAATWTLVGIAESLLEVRIVVARALAMRRICAASARRGRRG